MSTDFHILLVEDSPTDVLLTEEALAAGRFHVQSSERLADALKLLVTKQFDVILLDLGLPDSDGLDTLRTLRAKDPQVAVVVLTGKDEEELALQALKEGAQDCLVKGEIQPESLRRTIRYAVERSSKERTLRESERRLRSIADSLPALVAYVDAQMRYRFNNTKFEDWFGVPVEAYLGRPVGDFPEIAAFERTRDRMQAALAGQRVEFEDRLPNKDGGERTIQVAFVPHFGDAGTVEGFHILAYDITELKAAEESANQTERLAALGTLAAGIAHEINNPLSAARTSAEVALSMLGRPESSAMVDECLSIIVDSVKRCDQIVRDVLRLAHHEPLEKSWQDINAIVTSAVKTAEIFRRPKGVELRVKLSAPSARAFVNPLEIERVLLNLIQNAVEASSPGAIIEIKTVHRPAFAKLIVADSGQGMGPEELKRIFDPFYTKRKDGLGTGLGLSLADKIVREHGGKISVESKIGKGTTFTMELPLTNGEKTPGLTVS